MIPRLGDGNHIEVEYSIFSTSLENDSPSRGRKRGHPRISPRYSWRLENDSPSRGRKPNAIKQEAKDRRSLENDSPSRGRKHLRSGLITLRRILFRK